VVGLQDVVLTEKLREIYKPDRRSQYGGWQIRQEKGTGSFRVERDQDGRCWVIDPAGHPFISVGINAVRPNNTKRGHDRMRSVYGSKERRADSAASLMHEHAFNSLGAWSYWRSGRPFLISEFFAKAMDSGLPNTCGAGWIVKMQEARGAFYQNFALPLLRHGGCV